MIHKKILLLSLILSCCLPSIIFSMKITLKEQDAIEEIQRRHTLQSSAWSTCGIGSAFAAGVLLFRTAQFAIKSLDPNNQNNNKTVLGIGSLLCAGAAAGFTALMFHSITQSRKQYVNALRADILKKKYQYATNKKIVEPSAKNKQWEYFKASGLNLFSTAYSVGLVAAIFYASGRLVDGQFRKIPPAIGMLLGGSVILSPIAYLTAGQVRKNTINAIIDDAVRTTVPHSTNAYKNAMYVASGLCRELSFTFWLSCPLILPGILAWHSSKLSRAALIRAVKEDIITQPEHGDPQPITVVKA